MLCLDISQSHAVFIFYFITCFYHCMTVNLLNNNNNNSKCIGDDTKAAARQSLNCIKTKTIKYGEKGFSIWGMEFLHPAMWQDHDIDFARWHVALES